MDTQLFTIGPTWIIFSTPHQQSGLWVYTWLIHLLGSFLKRLRSGYRVNAQNHTGVGIGVYAYFVEHLGFQSNWLFGSFLKLKCLWHGLRNAEDPSYEDLKMTCKAGSCRDFEDALPLQTVGE